jgi:hypothetical protein
MRIGRDFGLAEAAHLAAHGFQCLVETAIAEGRGGMVVENERRQTRPRRGAVALPHETARRAAGKGGDVILR